MIKRFKKFVNSIVYLPIEDIIGKEYQRAMYYYHRETGKIGLVYDSPKSPSLLYIETGRLFKPIIKIELLIKDLISISNRLRIKKISINNYIATITMDEVDYPNETMPIDVKDDYYKIVVGMDLTLRKLITSIIPFQENMGNILHRETLE